MTMPHRLVSEIPAGPPAVFPGEQVGIGSKRIPIAGTQTAG